MQVKKPHKRERIIDVAKRLMVEKGIDGFSMEDIAREAKVGKGTVYVYFPSKENLVREIVRDVYSSFISDLEEATNAGSFRDFVERFVDSVLEDLEIRGGVLHSVRRSSFDSTELHREFGREFRGKLMVVFSKFKDLMDIDFESFYFSVVSFLMSAYIFVDEFGKGNMKNILVENILRVSTCRMYFPRDHPR